MADHTIEIFIDMPHDLKFHHKKPDDTTTPHGRKVKAPKGDKVRWISQDGDIRLTFSAWPFTQAQASITAKAGVHTAFFTIKPPNSNSTEDEHYKYAAEVAAVDEDPEIIIDIGGGN